MKEKELTTREKIILHSQEVFEEKGYKDIRVDDITEKAGVSHGTFYIYFKNKRDLLLLLVNDTKEELFSITEEPWGKGDVLESLRESITGFFYTYKKNWKMIRTWKGAAYLEEEFGDLWNELVNQIIQRIQQNIEVSIQKKAVREVDPIITAKALAGMIEHYANNILMKDEQLDIEKSANTIADLWYFALYA